MERKVKFAKGEYFHIYNRGTDKRVIFEDVKDYSRFIKTLYLLNTIKPIRLRDIPEKIAYHLDRVETLVDIGAYCLMPNHFHILIKVKDEKDASTFMEKIQTSHSLYFNKKYSRSGSLFQGPYKSSHVGRDEYLKYLFSYIHLNPISIFYPEWKEKGVNDLNAAKNFLNDYKYSSYHEYIGEDRLESKIINRNVFPEYFIQNQDFSNFLDFWLSLKNFEDQTNKTNNYQR